MTTAFNFFRSYVVRMNRTIIVNLENLQKAIHFYVRSELKTA